MKTASNTDARPNSCNVLNTSREELRRAIEGLSEEQMLVPVIDDWSSKDLLTHITAWEELTLVDMQRVARGHVPALACFQQDKVDAWNEMMMSLRRDFPLQQVMAELSSVRESIMAILDALLDDSFVQGFVPGTCQVTAFHDWDHANQIREWRKEAGV